MSAASPGKRAARLLGRLAAVLAVVSAFGWLAARAPFLRSAQAASRRGSASPAAPTIPPPAVPAPALGSGGGLISGFSLNGMRIASQEIPVEACDAGTWDPIAARLCRGRCRMLVQQRAGRVAHFGWLQVDGAVTTLHSGVLQCSATTGRGRLLHESLLLDKQLLAALPGQLGAHAADVPIDFAAGAWRITTTRTGSAEATVEAQELSLMHDGWRRLSAAPPGDAARDRVHVLAKGNEICLLSIMDGEDEPLVVSACQGSGRG